MFPLASIKIPMYIIEKHRRRGTPMPKISKKVYKCPNCAQEFGLESLFQLNLQREMRAKRGEKRERERKEAVVKLGKRGQMEGPKRNGTYLEPRYNEYLFNLEVNPEKNKRNLNYRFNFKSRKKEKKVFCGESQIRVRYRNSDEQE